MSVQTRLSMATDGFRGGSIVVNELTGPIVVRGDLEFVVGDATAVALIQDESVETIIQDELSEHFVEDLTTESVEGIFVTVNTE